MRDKCSIIIGLLNTSLNRLKIAGHHDNVRSCYIQRSFRSLNLQEFDVSVGLCDVSCFMIITCLSFNPIPDRQMEFKVRYT